MTFSKSFMDSAKVTNHDKMCQNAAPYFVTFIINQSAFKLEFTCIENGLHEGGKS